MAAQETDTMFSPPVARGMRVLDRSFFRKSVPLKAARVFDNTHIAKIRSQLERSKDTLQQARLPNVYPDPDPERQRLGKKCILLRPEIHYEPALNGDLPSTSDGLDRSKIPHSLSTPWPHSSILAELVQKNLVSVIPFQLDLEYDYWTYHEIMAAILPLETQEEIPSGFSQVGHVAHLNLRERYLQYKFLIAEVLLDKNPKIRTVINKIDGVGDESEFRTFRYEVLAGPDDMQVTVSEADCTFSFDYSKVYWNPRLQTEHHRLVDVFQKGEAICDVMAGIGPFAVPAGKKGVFVWANDLNPDSYASLLDAISKNKVGDFVKPFNADGKDFIRSAAAQLLQTDHKVEIKKKRSRKDIASTPTVLETIDQPKTFQRFVLNLPASALTFLPSFIGLYPPALRTMLPGGTKMPLIHVYCFSIKDELQAATHEGDLQSEDTSTEKSEAVGMICNEISRQLVYHMRPGDIAEEGCVQVYDVRDVAPKKRMFCATFRLPEEVAFRNG